VNSSLVEDEFTFSYNISGPSLSSNLAAAPQELQTSQTGRLHILFVDDLNPAAVTLVYQTHYSTKRSIESFRIFQSFLDIFVFIGCRHCGPHYSNLIGLLISGSKTCLNVISGLALVIPLVSILSVFSHALREP
jgi:hypothetical protein